MENNMVAFLKRAADRSGFRRDFFIEKDIPTISSNIIIIPFFGDIRSACVLSSFLLKQYKESRSTKYLILASWPGFQALFPYVDEYWSIKEESAVNSLASGANSFYNEADASVNYTRNLIENFHNVITHKDLKLYYDNGFTTKYWETFGVLRDGHKAVKRFLPDISSVNRLSDSFKQEMRKVGTKIMIFPTKKVRSWQQGRTEYISVPIDFWVRLAERLLAEGFIPVVYQNTFTYDLSPTFADRCIYLALNDMSHVLCAMKAVGCVLDIHSGISRLANLARCPYVTVDERSRFLGQKDNELDDLGAVVPKQYIFSFSTMLLSGSIVEWNNSLLDNVIVRLKKFVPTLDQDSSTVESYETVSYDVVREKKSKRLGVRFIRKH